MIFVDSDNAMGSSRGDVDDAFAIAALLRSGLPIAALSSVFGNASEQDAAANNRRIAGLCGFDGPFPRGCRSAGSDRSEASEVLISDSRISSVAALGPLTNIASAVRAGAGSGWSEVVVVGFDSESDGAFPPFWPHEFNMTADLQATRTVIDSSLPLTIVPLNLARRLRITRKELAAINGDLGVFLRIESNRWFWRCLLVKMSASFAVYDLVAAMLLIDRSLFEIRETTMELTSRGAARFGGGTRPVRVITGIDCDALLQRFTSLVNSGLQESVRQKPRASD